MTDDEILEVVQAHKEGKEIEWRERCAPQLSWINLRKSTTAGWFGWDFKNCDYRVAPEPRKPREWEAEIPLDGSVGQIFTDSRQLTKGGELIRVREVIEDRDCNCGFSDAHHSIEHWPYCESLKK